MLDWLSWAFSRQTVASYLLQRCYWPFLQILFYFFPCFILHTIVCLLSWWRLSSFILWAFASGALVKLPSSSCPSLCCSLLPWFLSHAHFFLLCFFLWRWYFFVLFCFALLLFLWINVLFDYPAIFAYLGLFVWKTAMSILKEGWEKNRGVRLPMQWQKLYLGTLFSLLQWMFSDVYTLSCKSWKFSKFVAFQNHYSTMQRQEAI